LPPNPIYRFDSKHPFAPGIYMEPNKTLPTGQGRFYVHLSDTHITAISEETESFWVYGFLSYADFMGEPHELRFCAKWQRYAKQADGAMKPMGFVYDSETPQTYTRNT
ncbi:MAG TPA: hypothetical protein VHB49_25160, partial [Bradyrhizobium sp.]|nr:hypothetical protein [Bradyrhizobium sp.]